MPPPCPTEPPPFINGSGHCALCKPCNECCGTLKAKLECGCTANTCPCCTQCWPSYWKVVISGFVPFEGEDRECCEDFNQTLYIANDHIVDANTCDTSEFISDPEDDEPANPGCYETAGVIALCSGDNVTIRFYYFGGANCSGFWEGDLGPKPVECRNIDMDLIHIPQEVVEIECCDATSATIHITALCDRTI